MSFWFLVFLFWFSLIIWVFAERLWNDYIDSCKYGNKPKKVLTSTTITKFLLKSFYISSIYWAVLIGLMLFVKLMG